ncbi:sigma-54 dependent transcriptional regulator [Sphingomonas sp. SUN039]|uniref:sigma-54-dependent transcriptional regulator n=1 Tax=Sphingomonas sp. SUN039 TaxID=2937787 RepID=UPI002164B9B9|nr:sigma-54 dependent transcriptional regulator [Sphingomonas sp. SUN039]UVO53117.1 sigma-54 dependent transcriptional regulator [Sphingomonas sp. SUN039]
MTSVTPATIIVVDDEAEVRSALRQSFEIEGMTVLEFADGQGALDRLSAEFAGVVITDLRMPGLDGTGLFNRVARLDPDLPVIVISGHGDIATAVDLVRRGAYDYLSKPFDADHLTATVRRALDKRALVLENRRLREPQPEKTSPLLGDSPQMEKVRHTLDQLVQADIDVLVSGESGTGKTLVAATLHGRSPRARKTMVTVDCRSLSTEQQAESLLFGHVSGAFAGAQFPRTGQLLQANAGTVFFDHVDGLPAFLQARLQQVLETGSVTPIGGNQPQSTQFRAISATASDVEAMSREGMFLPSLFYRLGIYRLDLPPLRARGDDVVTLFRAFLAEEAARLGREPPALSTPVWRRLHDHDWPGNVRELRSFAASFALGLEDRSAAPPATGAAGSLKQATAAFEATAIRTALERHKGDVVATTTELDLPRKTFYDKLVRHGIDPADYRSRR